jgi:hypothetical protein
MQTFETLLEKHGYAPAAISQMAQAHIAPDANDSEDAERYFNAIIGNYYIQYLALKLDQYGFDLNRVNLSPQELSKADNLITGKMGNAPMDNAYVVQCLEYMVIALRKAHETAPLTWQDLYDFSYTTKDGICLQGCEMIKALIRSDRIYTGTQAVHYRHRFMGLAFRTVSMKELMAHILPDVGHEDLDDINRYGQAVQDIAIDKVQNIIRAIIHLEPPKLHLFYELNTHYRVMQCVKDINALLKTSPLDLIAIGKIYTRFNNERYTRGIYSDDWQRFVGELESALEMIATPYRDTENAEQSDDDSEQAASANMVAASQAAQNIQYPATSLI